MMLSLGSFVHRTGYYAPVSNNKSAGHNDSAPGVFHRRTIRNSRRSDLAAAAAAATVTVSTPSFNSFATDRAGLQFTVTVLRTLEVTIVARV